MSSRPDASIIAGKTARGKGELRRLFTCGKQRANRNRPNRRLRYQELPAEFGAGNPENAGLGEIVAQNNEERKGLQRIYKPDSVENQVAFG